MQEMQTRMNLAHEIGRKNPKEKNKIPKEIL